MEFASPQMGKPPDHFRANDSCWRSKCVDRSFIMLSYIWVSVRGALSRRRSLLDLLDGSAALRPAIP